MSNILEYNHYENMFKAAFKKAVGRYSSRAELDEMERRRGIYTIAEIIKLVTENNLPIV